VTDTQDKYSWNILVTELDRISTAEVQVKNVDMIFARVMAQAAVS
jgi:hypothetical protein